MESTFDCPRGLVPTSCFPRTTLQTLGAPNRGDPPAGAQTGPGLVSMAPWSQGLGKQSCRWGSAVCTLLSLKRVRVSLRLSGSHSLEEGAVDLETCRLWRPLVPWSLLGHGSGTQACILAAPSLCHLGQELTRPQWAGLLR